MSALVIFVSILVLIHCLHSQVTIAVVGSLAGFDEFDVGSGFFRLHLHAQPLRRTTVNLQLKEEKKDN